MPLIEFPNIPNVPGVPLLPRSITVPTVDSLINLASSQILGSIFGLSIWGIYDQNDSPIIVFDTFLEIDFKNGSNVPTHPVEEGGFGTYNKVNTPYDCKVTVAVGGDEFLRSQFLETCSTMLNSTDFYSVVTPEKTYLNATLQNYAYRRQTRNGGASMLTVAFWFLEIRSNTKNLEPIPADPSAYDMISGGQVQAGFYKAVDNLTSISRDWMLL